MRILPRQFTPVVSAAAEMAARVRLALLTNLCSFSFAVSPNTSVAISGSLSSLHHRFLAANRYQSTSCLCFARCVIASCLFRRPLARYHLLQLLLHRYLCLLGPDDLSVAR